MTDKIIEEVFEISTNPRPAMKLLPSMHDGDFEKGVLLHAVYTNDDEYSLIYHYKFKGSKSDVKRNFKDELSYFIKEYEPEIAPHLNVVVKSHKGVKIGSYPVVGNKDYYVMVTLESLNEENLSAALNDLLQKIPKKKVIKIEA